MRLINVKAFIEREQVMSRQEERVDCQTEVLEFADDEATAYAILSHRWIGREVAYEEMADLTMMKKDEQDEVRRRPGYQKILDSCEQAQKDGFIWLWVDTCCIDKRSSAELSEAINSMYRWYENSRVCYAYLHDVPGLSFPTRSDNKTYPNSNGWPEWFSRGWTLQEMIAPGNVQFFNKDWKPIGNKKTLSRTLADITRVPPHILTDGLGSNRPCVAQILSWAADRTTTRVEDRAYSLMGLLDVNMPMLYGEGKKAFHRLQLEIIRMSDDQSIFAWDPHERIARTGSFLADDPSFFQHCSDMELMDRDEFIEALKRDIPEEELSSINEDRFGVFPITNRGIQIWLLLRSWDDSRSVLEALLPCRIGPSDPPMAIKLALWKSNHYRYFPFLWDDSPTERTLQFRQVYLRSRYQAQDTQPRDATFEVDDSAVTVNGFTCHGAYPPELTENTLTLTSARPHCVKVYSDIQAKRCFAVGFGQYFDQNWIHFLYPGASNQHSWEGCSFKLHSKQEHNKTLVRGSDHDQSSAGHSPDDCDGRLWVKHTRLGPTWTVRTSCIVRESSKTGVKIEVFRDPDFGGGSAEWTCFDVERTSHFNCDMRGLMLRDHLCQGEERYPLLVDGVSVEFSLAPNGIKLGDYGYITAGSFRCEGNILSEFKSRSPISDIALRQHIIDCDKPDSYYVTARPQRRWLRDRSVTVYKPRALLLPSNDHFHSFLASLPTTIRLTNKYLVTTVVQCDQFIEDCGIFGGSHTSSLSDTSVPTPFCTIAKPFVWHRDEGAGSASGGAQGTS